MGLAVLPSRLAVELEEVRSALLEGSDLFANPLTASHAQWAESIKKNHPEYDENNSLQIIRQEVGEVFEQVLRDSGVFKRDENGCASFRRFIDTLK